MNWRRWKSAPVLLAVLALAACARVSPPPVTSAVMAGLSAGPPLAALGMAEDDADTALASFVESCPKLLARDDQSGLTQRSDWQPRLALRSSAPGRPPKQWVAGLQ